MSIWVVGGASFVLGIGIASYLLLQTKQKKLSEEEKREQLYKHAAEFHRKFEEVGSFVAPKNICNHDVQLISASRTAGSTRACLSHSIEYCPGLLGFLGSQVY